MALDTHALCSLAELKSYMGISADTWDDQLEELINAATAQAESHTGRELAARDQEWALDGNNETDLVVPQWPLNSISSLEINGVEISARESWQGYGYVIDSEAGMIQLQGYVFTGGLANIEISANAGYATVPADLEQAVVELAAWKAKQSQISDIGQGWLGKQSEAKPQNMGTTSLVRGVPREIAEVFGRYTRMGGI